MSFENSSYYILPMRVNSEEGFYSFLDCHKEWSRVKEMKQCNYLFKYVSRAIEDEESCRVYRHNAPASLNIFTFDCMMKSGISPKISEISIYSFETGIAFFEVKVNYTDMPISDIINFAYHFKVTNRASREKYNTIRGDKTALYDVFRSILPSDVCCAELFFSGRENVKIPALCYHMIKTDKMSEEEQRATLFLLKHSYNEGFAYNTKSDLGMYDMTYLPYEYMTFGGCQEGFAVLCHTTGVEKTDAYMDNIFTTQLNVDYHYLYLILLNQRFSEIKYAEEIATSDNSKEIVEELNERIVQLKTKYSFHIVSDDYIYQNVYSKLYEILDIDKLFLDIEENGDRLALLQANDSQETEKESNSFLMCLSFLAIFSALVDLATYLDRMPITAIISTVLGLVMVILIVGIAISRIIKRRIAKRKKKKNKK